MIISGGITISGSFSVTGSEPPSYIGQPFEGGYYAGTYSITGDNRPTHLLIVSDKAYEVSNYWDNGINQSVSTTDFDGWYNTNRLNDDNHPIFQQARNLTINGYADWYIPSKYEMWAIRETLNPLSANNTSYGANPYKFPKSTSNWLSVCPAETWAVDFRGGSQAFTTGWYWTSTESSNSSALAVAMSVGSAVGDSKSSVSNLYRPIRRVPYSDYVASRGTYKGTFRYWRWRVTSLKSGTYLYVDEFAFQYNQMDVNLIGTTMTVPGGFTSGLSINPISLINQSIDYEYVDLNFPTNGYSDFRFDLGYEFSFTGYRWRTPSNANGDPASWTIQGSNDGTNWTVLHTVSNYSATTARNVWQPAWNFL